jgi:hypothetical protein
VVAVSGGEGKTARQAVCATRSGVGMHVTRREASRCTGPRRHIGGVGGVGAREANRDGAGMVHEHGAVHVRELGRRSRR